jgi:hypothetical protein
MEHPLPNETKVALHHSGGKYEGIVKYCICQETGYLLGLAFDDNYRWSRADFQPSHLLELPRSSMQTIDPETKSSSRVN